MAENTIDFGELSTDESLKKSVTELHDSVKKFGDFLQLACEKDVYSNLSTEDRVKYDLFLSYSLSTLFWTYLRTQGLDPTKHAIKGEIERVRGYNIRARQIHERRTIMPRIDKAAAGRFVRSGLWQPRSAEERQQEEQPPDESVDSVM
ncbi:nuclear nucleic acid-binding protein C1D [Schistocerca cancellata]|uniref:nuclear nucleic acid-binding protein C1D n=1 Tax=Schistocerca cancellata TaxID=274614 RepID=UPI002118AED8|nr:nuclear nucleic acid-binding protein C1D [Schistocerca cancellata]